MEKTSRTSKISAAFNDNLDIDKLANVASMMKNSAVAPVAKQVAAPAAAKVVKKKESIKVAPLKKDRRLTIVVPHTTYMKMVIKTKENGITFQKYINELIEKDKA